MKSIYLATFFLIINFANVWSQPKTRTFPRNINMTGYSSYYPAVSGDGNSLVFMTNFTNTEEPSMRYTYKMNVSEWSDPEDLPRSFNLNHLLFEGGYSLNFDGKEFYFTMKKSNGLGGYDIYMSKKSGASWQPEINLGNGINSSAHEAMPSVSTNGTELYFCRCESMNAQEASGCSIYVATLKGKYWKDPVALPANINSYAPTAPKILADGETLLFSSSKNGNADLYITRKEDNGSWSDPVPLDFVNSSQKEQFVSVAAKGRYLYHDIKGSQGRALQMLLIPDEFKANSIMHIKGTVVDGNDQAIKSILKVYNVETRERIIMKEIGENEEFNFALKEGKVYDLSIEANDNTHAYYSKLYDLSELSKSGRDDKRIRIPSISKNEEIELGGLVFDEFSASINDNSIYELRRVTRLIKSNPDLKFELNLHRYDYFEDSVASTKDLTEVIIDTLWIENEAESDIRQLSTDNAQADSLLYTTDSTTVNTMDSTKLVTNEPIYELKYTYHNDRTLQQANAVIEYLTNNGVSGDQLYVNTSQTEDSPPRGKPEIVVSIKIL